MAPEPSDAATAWRRAPSALWRHLTDGVLVLGTDADGPVEVTGPAAALWDLLAAPTTAPDAADELAGRHGVDAAQVLADIGPVLERWAADGAIEPG